MFVTENIVDDQMTTSLTDSHGRRIDYLRLSVTDRCDLRCSYCLPKRFRGFEHPDHWLNFDEIERLTAVFAHLGVRHVRLTGGEPLVRRNLPALAARLAALPGIEDLSLSTNGTRLARFAGLLHEAGIRRLNLSLDSLDADRYRELTGGGRLGQVLDGLRAARDVGMQPIKINMVVLGGVNDDEVPRLVEFCAAGGYILRLIEPMPIGSAGRSAARHYVGLDTIEERLARHYRLIPDHDVVGGGPARYLRVAGTGLQIGLITPISQHFCATCNRVRLTVDGTLLTCLGQEHSVALRPLLRSGADDMDVEAAVRAAVAAKPARHEFREQPEKVLRLMASTGG